MAKYADDGGYFWVKPMGVGVDSTCGLTVDADGNIFLVGSFPETVTIGGTTLTSRGESDIYVAKLDSDGNFQLERACGRPSTNDSHRSVNVDSSWIYLRVRGLSGTPPDFGGTTNRHDDGNMMLSLPSWMAMDSSYGQGDGWGCLRQCRVNVDSSSDGSIYVSGEFRETANIGNHDQFVSAGEESDAFTAKVDPRPTEQCSGRTELADCHRDSIADTRGYLPAMSSLPECSAAQPNLAPFN